MPRENCQTPIIYRKWWIAISNNNLLRYLDRIDGSHNIRLGTEFKIMNYNVIFWFHVT